jgi:hypothetical protein
MEGFVFFALLIAGVVAFAASAASKRRGVVNAAWGAAASSRHLLFKPAELLSGPEIVGTLHGCRVRIDTVSRGGDNAKKYTRFKVEYPWSLGLDLKLTERGTLSSIATFFGGQDIETGDTHFDERVVVKGADAKGVVRFLTPARRQRILDLLRAFPKAVAKDSEITWERQKVLDTTFALLEPLDRMVALSRHFTGDREADEIASHALGDVTVRAAARPEAGRAMQPPTAPAAAVVIGKAGFQIVDLPRPEIEPASEPQVPSEQVQPAETGPNSEALTPQALADALFGPSVMSYQLAEVFDARFRGHHVTWSGTLTSVTPYPFDRVFGNTPGLKATVKVVESTGPTGRQSVQAVVQLPTDALSALRSSLGKPVAFEGDLTHCDGFMNCIYIASGRILWAGRDE